MTPPAADPAQPLARLIDGLVGYLVGCQETEGEYAGSFYSELAYHIPLLDYRAGSSHHNRTVGSAALSFVKLAHRYPQHELLSRARHALSWVLSRQHEDGGMFEITNRDRPSQFHLRYERSSISLGIVCHGLYAAMRLGLPAAAEYIAFLVAGAQWQLTVETDPGNFLHTEGYPPDKLILNAAAHAAETLLIGAAVTIDSAQRRVFLGGAERAIQATLACQRENGMLPYSRYPDDNSISYTATVCWVLQNLLEARLMPASVEGAVRRSLDRAAEFLSSCVQESGAIDWETWENHGQKYHTWVYGIMARALAWHGDGRGQDCAARLVGFLHRELYDPDKGLCRLFDFPVGEQRTICGLPVKSEDFHECAYHQADLLDCLVDVEGLLVG